MAIICSRGMWLAVNIVKGFIAAGLSGLHSNTSYIHMCMLYMLVHVHVHKAGKHPVN